MRQAIKNLMSALGIRRAGRPLRSLRRYLYSIVDAAGHIIFLPLKILKNTNSRFDFRPRKILIIRLDRIGDLLVSTPALRAVRESFPEAKIHLLVSGYTKDLVINNQNIDRVLVYGEDEVEKDYDAAIALHPGFRQNRLTLTSGAKTRVGYLGWGGGFFLTHALVDDRAVRIRHEVESALEVVAAIGAKTGNMELEVSVTDAGERFADEFLAGNDHLGRGLLIGMHPGSRQAYIRWSAEGFANTADALCEKFNARIILFGGDQERLLVKEVSDRMRHPAGAALGLSLTELVSLIKRCRLFISNSTGPMHIAAALKVPVVAIFGNIHPLDSYQEWGPWGDNNVVVSKKLACVDCHPGDCETLDCMSLITAEEVFSASCMSLQKIREIKGL